jgi:hypothetical protein
VTLAEYIEGLIGALRTSHPVAFDRMCEVVGARKARIILDRESVDVWFEHGRLQTRAASQKRAVHGSGQTDSVTVLDLLNGYLEINTAILEGRLEVRGKTEDVSRIFVAIDILLDVSPRSPALQQLARQFEAERETRTDRWRVARNGAGGLFSDRDAQDLLLARLDLLA